MKRPLIEQFYVTKDWVIGINFLLTTFFTVINVLLKLLGALSDPWFNIFLPVMIAIPVGLFLILFLDMVVYFLRQNEYKEGQ